MTITIVSTTTTDDGVRTLVFDILRADTLSSNQASHHFVKMKLVKQLREAAIEAGLQLHDSKDHSSVKKRVQALQDRQNWQTKKAAITKKLKKQGKSKEEIEAELELAVGDKASYEAANAIEVPFLYDRARVRVLVGNTVNRDFDPPNLWPTVKALTDGLTDCAWWEDDNFNHLSEVSFSYGEKSDQKGHYRFTLVVEPLD